MLNRPGVITNGSAVVRISVCVFLLAAVFMAVPVYAEDTPNIATLRAKAEGGDADAQYHLEQCYGLGEGVPKDMKQAAEWFRKAAEQGDAEAQFHLGLCYLWSILADFAPGTRPSVAVAIP